MLLIRMVEERLAAMCKKGEAGDLHFSRGQEAISVGVCAALQPTDRIVTHHRTIAHAIAKGADLYPLIAEILGKRTGYNKGRAGEMHINIPSIRYDFSFQLVGTCVPVAVGLAWAVNNYLKTGEVVACFFGDAASSNGAIHEGLTIASIHKVPLLLVCENNGRAGNITSEHYLPTENVGQRMAAYGIPYVEVDGNDVEMVQRWAAHLVAFIRRNPQPMMLECRTERLCHHKMGQGDIRTKEQLAKASEGEPLRRWDISPERGRRIEREIELELDEVFARVDQDPVAEFP
jgi:pyruvate dehydrogenase E1 component alpha subunit